MIYVVENLNIVGTNHNACLCKISSCSGNRKLGFSKPKRLKAVFVNSNFAARRFVAARRCACFYYFLGLHNRCFCILLLSCNMKKISLSCYHAEFTRMIFIFNFYKIVKYNNCYLFSLLFYIMLGLHANI